MKLKEKVRKSAMEKKRTNSNKMLMLQQCKVQTPPPSHKKHCNTNTTGQRVIPGFEEADMTRIKSDVGLWASAV